MADRYLQEQEDLNARTALVCAVLANCFRDTKKKTKPFEIADFMPHREEKKQEKQTVEQMRQQLETFTKAMQRKAKKKSLK